MRAMELELLQARQTAAAESGERAKVNFLANMSIELRTPLNAIIGFSEAIKSNMFGRAPEKYQEYAEHINMSGIHLLCLINAILDVAQADNGGPELSEMSVDMSAITRD
jgi:signal transduction histidine kinase